MPLIKRQDSLSVQTFTSFPPLLHVMFDKGLLSEKQIALSPLDIWVLLDEILTDGASVFTKKTLLNTR